MKARTVRTIWEVRTYDVWGNAKDGYDVNDVWEHGNVTLDIPVKTYNTGTPQQFESAFPTDRQLRSALGWNSVRLDVTGDDVSIYVNRDRDGYPMGELHCVSHDSLSPIREKQEGNGVI